MASLPSRDYFPLCPLVALVCAHLPRCGEMMLERGLHVEHTTIYRLVQCYAPALEQLSSRRNTGAAKRFFSKALAAPHSSTPGVITVDKHARSEERRVGKECRSRWSPYH